MKETWRKEEERQELHNLLLILDLLDLDHSEPEISGEGLYNALGTVPTVWGSGLHHSSIPGSF